MSNNRLLQYWNAGVEEVLPGIPYGGKLSALSGVSPFDCAKVPGRFNRNKEWTGVPDWTTTEITLNEINRWSEWPTPNICLRTADYPAWDFDANSQKLADAFCEFCQQELGIAPIRGRDGSPRCLLVFKRDPNSKPWGKVRIVFRHPDIPFGNNEPASAIEGLAAGQQFVAEGTHKSGKLYRYKGDDILQHIAKHGSLSVVTDAQWRAFVAKIGPWLESQGGQITFAEQGTGAQGDDKEIGDDTLRSYDLEKLADALKHIPNEKRDRQSWIALLYALKMACSGSEDFFLDHVLPWCMQYPGNDEDGVRRTWEGIPKSSIGVDAVYAEARKNGWHGAPEEFDNLDEGNDENANSGSTQGAGNGTENINSGPTQSAGNSTENANSGSTQGESRKGSHIPDFSPLPEDFDVTKLKMFHWVLGTTAMKGAVNLIYGQSSASKSTFALLRAISIASGHNLTGEEVQERGHVIYYNAEDPKEVIWKRIGAILQHYEIPREEIRPYLHLASGQDFRLVMARKIDDVAKPPPAVDELIQFIRDYVGMIVHVCVDPLVNLHSGLSENSNDEMEELITTLRTVARQGNCSVDLVHHTSKQRPNNSGDMNAARGASSIIAAVRSGLRVTLLDPEQVKTRKLNGRVVEIKMVKANYSPLEETPWLFRLSSVCINNGPGGSSEFPPDDGSAFLHALGDRIGVLELNPPSEVSDGNAAAADDKRQKALAAVIKVMGGKQSVRQSEIVKPLMAELRLKRTKTIDALDEYLPLDKPQTVVIGPAVHELFRRKVSPGLRAPIEIALRVVSAKAAA